MLLLFFLRVWDKASWLQTILSHRTKHHSPASSVFEAPWTEHAQWHPVNKLLVEALMASCEAVHWPRIRPGTTSFPLCKQFPLTATGMRNVLEGRFLENHSIYWLPIKQCYDEFVTDLKGLFCKTWTKLDWLFTVCWQDPPEKHHRTIKDH